MKVPPPLPACLSSSDVPLQLPCQVLKVQRASIRPNEDELHPDKKQATASRWRVDASYAGAGEKSKCEKVRASKDLQASRGFTSDN